MPELLEREKFQRLVLERNHGKCVFCDAPAVDAHHILDRKLFENGGYYLNNGAAVCADHHWLCEMTEISLPEVYRAAGITDPVFPPGFETDIKLYDKWGNKFIELGALEPLRVGGPLKDDDGCRNALKRAGLLWTLK